MKDYAEESEKFKMKHIYSHIASTEQKEGTVGLWLHSLNTRNYPDLRGADNKVITDKTSDAEKTESMVGTTSNDTTHEAKKIGIKDISVSDSNSFNTAADINSEPKYFEKIADAKDGDVSSEICADMNSEIRKIDA